MAVFAGVCCGVLLHGCQPGVMPARSHAGQESCQPGVMFANWILNLFTKHLEHSQATRPTATH